MLITENNGNPSPENQGDDIVDIHIFYLHLFLQDRNYGIKQGLGVCVVTAVLCKVNRPRERAH